MSEDMHRQKISRWRAAWRVLMGRAGVEETTTQTIQAGDEIHEQFGGVAFIQWKGTDVCMDVDCPNPECHDGGGHFDGDFAYFLRCYSCGAIIKLGSHVPVYHVTPGHPEFERASEFLKYGRDDFNTIGASDGCDNGDKPNTSDKTIGKPDPVELFIRGDAGGYERVPGVKTVTLGGNTDDV